MKTKHILIEILPRLLWVIELTTLIVFESIFFGGPKTTSDNWVLFIGIVLTIWGIYALVTTFYKLAKPMFTKELVTSGPYRYVRHPMYVSMYILLFGLGLIFFSGLWFMIMLAFIPVWYIDCLLEEMQMTDLWGQKYRDYKRRTGMFIPKFWF